MYELLSKREILRKTLHLLTSVFPILLYYYGKEACSLYFFLAGILFIFFDIARQINSQIKSIYNYFFSIITRDYEQEGLTSAFYICLAIILVTFLFDERIAIASLLIMSLSDPFAYFFGLYFGKFKIYDKSLEGSITFFFVSSSILIFFGFPYFEVIIVSLFCAVVELFSNKINLDDNLLIPFTASVTLSFL